MKVIQKGQMLGMVSVERVASNMATYYFQEVSSGVYYVAKDRFDTYDKQYIGSKKVMEAMNLMTQPVVIKRLDGTLILNRKMQNTIEK